MTTKFQKLSKDFYLRSNVIQVRKELLGKFLVTNIDGIKTGGMITEVESYNGIIDKASHAFGGRRTARTENMFASGGVAYVYLCYGIHHLFNVVTNEKNIPEAILIRAIEPLIGIEEMLKRRKKERVKPNLTSGPGSMSSALGIKISESGIDLTENKIFIEDRVILLTEKNIISTKRIGVDYAEKDALINYRFYIKGNKFISQP
ncbi:MAG: DNA-3-methyladenine glycosylase [Sphingobacteriales bacterium]|nr:MAG: DNA-3-methyladenine glycosylase [Sphingobacteriales bacterium]